MANSEEIKAQKEVLAAVMVDIATLEKTVDLAAKQLKHCPMEHADTYARLVWEARSAIRLLNIQRREEKTFLIGLVKEKKNG